MSRIGGFITVFLFATLASTFGVAWSAEPTDSDKTVIASEVGKAASEKAPEKRIPDSAAAGEAQKGAPHRPGELFISERQAGLVLGIIALMSFLFFLLFWWQQRGERASYFGKIYLDTLETLEFSRVSAPIDEKWNQGIYLNEFLRASSERANKWLKDPKNKKPKPSPEQLKAASEVEFEAELIARQQDLPPLVEQHCSRLPRGGMTRLPSWGEGRPPSWSYDENRRPGRRDAGYGGTWLPGLGGLGDSDGIGRQHGTTIDDEKIDPQREKEEQEKRRKRNALRADFDVLQDDWASRAAAEVWGWYQKDRDKAKEEATKQAKRGLDIDFSALRGRGPEFVLEFTAVVVIIFAAAILGILDILKSEQIGTLLAAIAGYVLGRATTRPRTSSETTSPDGTDKGPTTGKPT